MPDADADAPKKSRFAQHRDLLAALASGTVAALALATSTYNVYLQRQQVRAQVWPCLSLGGEFDDGVFSISVTNDGTGPAKVKRFRVTVDGKPAKNWIRAEGILLGTERVVDSFSIHGIEEATLSPGVEHKAFVSRRNGRALVAERRRLAVSICYCSTLGDCWEIVANDVFDTTTTSPVSECIADAQPFKSLEGDILDQMAKSAPDAGEPPREQH